MERLLSVAIGAFVVVVTSVGIFVGVARTSPEERPYGPPIGPKMPQDTGAGEELLVVVGGVFASRAEAEAANEAMGFGDLQGYYVVPVAQFQGFREQVETPGGFALASAFRTQEGADEFVALARSFGVPASVLATRVRSLGGVYAGLGQEGAPDGSGPLTTPVAESLP
ncbi:MAG TPA: hypothetical protein VEC15_09905 [Actinomycetota bacterium]|nr:hypothetical protein [Actinomycetota bacterium]